MGGTAVSPDPPGEEQGEKCGGWNDGNNFIVKKMVRLLLMIGQYLM